MKYFEIIQTHISTASRQNHKLYSTKCSGETKILIEIPFYFNVFDVNKLHF